MKVFFTSSTKYLSREINDVGKFTFTKFCDGELFLKLQENVSDQDVFVVTNTIAPSQNILELIFLLDTLDRQNAKINIFFTYFAYARQDRVNEEGEALSADIISRIIKLYEFKKIYILHPHSDRLFKFLDFKPIIPFDFFEHVSKNFDTIVSPDRGGIPIAERIAKILNCEFVYLEKTRPEHDKIDIIHDFKDVKNKKVIIIDDMITTGSTSIKAADWLFKQQAKSVSVAATHGILCGNAKANLKDSAIEKVYITNSIEHNELPTKIEVFSIDPLLKYCTQ